MPKKQTSFDLSPEAMQLLNALRLRMSLSRTGILEVLIRDRAEREGLRPPATPSREAKPG